MKVLIVNTVVLNTGDAAILQGLLEILREAFGPTVRAIVFDAHADVAPKYYPGVEFRRPPYEVVTGPAPARRRNLLGRILGRAARNANLARFQTGFALWRHGRRTLARLLLRSEEVAFVEEFSTADLVVSTGGTYLVEHYALGPKWFDIGLAIDLLRPLVLFTQSLGPFRDASHREQMRHVADASSLVLLRDLASRDHLLELGVEAGKLVVAADAAFALGVPARTPQAGHSVSGPPLRVAISVRDWRWFEGGTASDGMARFRAAIVEVTRRLVEDRGAHVTYVSTCQGVPAYAMDDSKTADEIVAALPPAIRARVIVDRAFHTPGALGTMLATFDLVIATRMHFAILAMMAGKATVPIAYEFKTRELFAEMNLGQLVADIETLTAESLLARVDWALEHRGELESAINESVARERTRAHSVAALLRDRHAPRPDALVTTAT